LNAPVRAGIAVVSGAAKLGLEANAGAVKQHLVVQIARPDGAKRSGTRYAVEHAIQQADGIVAFLP
jgi:hypothetical protein